MLSMIALRVSLYCEHQRQRRSSGASNDIKNDNYCFGIFKENGQAYYVLMCSHHSLFIVSEIDDLE